MPPLPKSSHPKSCLLRPGSSWPSGPTGLPRPSASACTCGPAWRTAPLSLDGLCQETTPPMRPEGSGEKLSFSHRNFAPIAPSREPVISARPALLPSLTTSPPRLGPHGQARAQPGHRARQRPQSSGSRALLSFHE